MKNEATTQHLSGEVLIGMIYDAAPTVPAAMDHLSACGHCQGRLHSMKERRRVDADLAAVGSLENAALARQRAAIYARLDSPRVSLGSRWLWAGAPLAAAAALLVMVNTGGFQQVAVDAPAAQVQSQAGDSETLYADIYQSLSLDSPAGVHAVAGMFETSTAQQ